MEVPLKELLEHRICALDKRIDERFCARDHNLALQAKEYERRLTDLNHEQERLESACQHFMPREIADSRQKEFEDWRGEINDKFSTAAGRTTITTVVLSAIISGAIFLLSRMIQ